MADAWKQYLEEMAFNNAIGAVLMILSKPDLRKKFDPALRKIYKVLKIACPEFWTDPTLQ